MAVTKKVKHEEETGLGVGEGTGDLAPEIQVLDEQGKSQELRINCLEEVCDSIQGKLEEVNLRLARAEAANPDGESQLDELKQILTRAAERIVLVESRLDGVEGTMEEPVPLNTDELRVVSPKDVYKWAIEAVLGHLMTSQGLTVINSRPQTVIQNLEMTIGFSKQACTVLNSHGVLDVEARELISQEG